jgi:outer membrane biogenesis lipoprotein LolB
MLTRHMVQGDGQSRWMHRFRFPLVLSVASLTLAACASAASPRQASRVPAPAPVTQVYFYPNAGQSAAQQDRDRYECYLWAVKQSGFDPSQPQLAPQQRVEVMPMPAPGHDTAVGAATGAVIGAVVSRPHDALKGAVVGAAAGAIIGAASDTARQQQAERVQQHYEQGDAQRTAHIEQQAQNYRRAMTACLEGRGYTVR